MQIVENMPIAEYHARSELSSSGVRRLLTNPYLFKTLVEQTPAMRLGSAIHARLLEPEVFSATYVQELQVDKRTKAGKEAYEEWAVANAGRIALSASEMETIDSCVSSIYNTEAIDLFRNGKSEVSVFGSVMHNNEEIPARARPDFLTDSGIIVDLKTTKDASPNGFGRSFAKLGYHIQAEWYRKVCGIEKVLFVAVETAPPYTVGVFEEDIAYQDLARDEIYLALEIYKRLDLYQKPIYRAIDGSTVHTLTPPAYLFCKTA